MVKSALHPDPQHRIAAAGDLSLLLDEQLDRLSRSVGKEDMRLIMSLHLASKSRHRASDSSPVSPESMKVEEMNVAELLAGELDEFAEAQKGMVVDMGDRPRNADAFKGVKIAGAPRLPRPEKK